MSVAASTRTAPLAALLPGPGDARLDADQVLERFVSYATAGGLELYPAQEEAILELVSGKHVILSTPTGSGKSLVAQALHFQALAEGKTSWYTAPIKALVNEKFFALCEAFGAENVGMLTGDASINRDAPIVCCTAEVLANLALREEDPAVDYVVMDEFHYYGDPERGIAWQIPLLTLGKATFLLMSATLGDTSPIEEGLRAVTGREVATVRAFERPVPLEFDYSERALHEALEKLVEGNRHPVYLVNFSQRAAAEQAQNLMSVNFSSKEEKERIRAEVDGFRFDTPYGKELSRFVLHGIGLHHAGLLPKYRLLVERLAQAGLLKVISGTDTLGVGVNIPIRTVLFSQLCKYDGEKVGVLTVRDFLQIAGRAGRKGFDDRGWVVAQAPEHAIENLRIAEKQASNPKKKLVKKQAPTKGYAHWDAATFERLRTKPPEPLQSRFEVSHGLLLALLQAEGEATKGERPSFAVAPGEKLARASAQARPARRGGGYRRLLELVSRSHGSDRLKARHKRDAAVRFRQLRHAGIIELVREGGGSRVQVAGGLQDDFSLHHTLSLYLLAALDLLDPASGTFALDVLTLVESILENPHAILFKQLDRAKGEKIAELKAQGMDYEDRMAELEKVEWPKPNRDFVYTTFNAFADKHPWVGDENIRLKSVAREMYEQLSGFHDYVRDLGLQRSEGVLLRYLSDVYKALAQSVPEAYRDEEVEAIVVWLRGVVRGVDSSLLDEWERMQGLAPSSGAAAAEEKPYHLADDRRGLTLRVRTELHRLLKALATKDSEAAAACVRPGWTSDEIAAQMAPYWEEHASIDLTPNARKAHNTILTEAGPRQWQAVQKIVDPTGEADWTIECTVDLREWVDDGAPILTLGRIGG